MKWRKVFLISSQVISLSLNRWYLGLLKRDASLNPTAEKFVKKSYDFHQNICDFNFIFNKDSCPLLTKFDQFHKFYFHQ